MLFVDAQHLALQLLRLVLETVLRLLDERRTRWRPNARLHRLLVQRPQEQAHEHAEDHEHPSVGQVQALVHPQENVDDEDRHRVDGRAQDAAVRVRIIEVVAEARQPPMLERARIQLVAEITRWWDRQRDAQRRASAGPAVAWAPDHYAAAEPRLVLLHGEG